MKALTLAALIALLATPVMAQTLALKGATGEATTIDASALAQLPQVTVKLDSHGESHSYQGPLLIDVLALVNTPKGKAIHGPAMANAVLVWSDDGYKVALGLAELDPGTRSNRIILAWKSDGGPMSDKDGAFKLIAEGDLRPARSARNVKDIRVIDLGKP